MPEDFFSPADCRQMDEHGIDPVAAASQFAQFTGPSPAILLDRPCRVGDGIKQIANSQHDTLLALWEQAAADGRFVKFVPASGAATRMFASLIAAIEAKGEMSGQTRQAVHELLDSLSLFAFASDLEDVLARQGKDLNELISQRAYLEILGPLLGADGLDYARFPKGLIKFHLASGEGHTAFTDQLLEGAQYLRDSRGICRTHCTVPFLYQEAFQAELASVKLRWERVLGVEFSVTFSYQSSAMDTIAVDLQNRPFRDSDGRLVFRPGGHGALISNLIDLHGDIVFIKNIDNILPIRDHMMVAQWKKLLAGILLLFEKEVLSLCRELEKSNTAEVLLLAQAFIEGNLGLCPPKQYSSWTASRRQTWLYDRLHRPLRVCGVVKNEGEPGGGPFWVRDSRGEITPQIVETSQINATDPMQQSILFASTHFNPVDVLCSLRDHHGENYDLRQFIDPSTFFVAEKSHGGEPLKALELPGLWNGAMAFWNTVFVEVPVATFAPVKSVFDLLRPQHV